MDGNQKPSDPTAAPMPLEPGATISPGAVTNAAPAPAIPPAPVVSDAAPVEAAAAPEADMAPPASAPVANTAAETPLFNQPDANENPEAYGPAPAGAISWTASEFIAHQKSAGWYATLFGAAAVIALLVWLLTKDVVSSIVVIFALGVLAMYASRKPRELQYIADEHGLIIGEKQYPYSAFRSFAVIPEGPFSSIELLPHKRFAPSISIYYDPADEPAIAEILAQHLPLQPRKRDAIDQLMHRIRF